MIGVTVSGPDGQLMRRPFFITTHGLRTIPEICCSQQFVNTRVHQCTIIGQIFITDTTTCNLHCRLIVKKQKYVQLKNMERKKTEKYLLVRIEQNIIICFMLLHEQLNIDQCLPF